MAIINGDSNPNTLFDTINDDVISGLAGDDEITVTSGRDNVDGGDGIDTLTINWSSTALDISIDLNLEQAFVRDSGGTSYFSSSMAVGFSAIESFRIFTGSGNDNFQGSIGNDTIDGGGGSDILLGGNGADLLIGGAGNDYLDGGSADETEIDFLYGGIGNDTYIVNSTSSALDIVFEGSGFAGGANDIDTIISKGGFYWDFYDVGEILTIDAVAGTGSQLVSGKGNSTLNGNDFSNILLAYGGSNVINPGRGTDTVGLSLYGLASGFNGSNTVKLKPGDDINYIYDFESLTDKIDTSAYGRFASGTQLLANIVDTPWGALLWMGMHEGEDEYIGIVGLQVADLGTGDFLV